VENSHEQLSSGQNLRRFKQIINHDIKKKKNSKEKKYIYTSTTFSNKFKNISAD
jgi:hypothetical protein